MADRDVTLRIGTRQQGDLAAPMKALAREAREAGRAVDDADAKLKRLDREWDKALVARGRANAARAGGGGGGGGGGGAGGGFGRALGQAVGRFGFGGGVAGAAAAALGAINGGVGLAQHGGPFGQGSFNQGRFDSRGVGDSLIWKSGELPLVGNLLKLSTEYERLEQRVERVRQAEEALHRTEQRIALSRGFVAERVGLGDELARAQGRLQYGSSSMGAQFALGTAGQYRAEREQAALGRRTPFGLDRASAQADAAARVGAETRLAQTMAEQERRRHLEGAERFRTENLVLDRQEALHRAQERARATGANLAAAQNGRRREEPSWWDRILGANSGAYQGSPKGFTQDQIDQRRLQHEAALLAVKEAERQLEESLDRQRQQSAARGDTLLEQQRERLGLMEQERDRLTGIVRQERERLQAGKEQFGLQSPLARQGLLELSRKIKRGGELTEAEIQFAQQSGGDLFRPALQGIGRKRAGADYDELARNLGADQRLKSAEQARVALEQKISVEIKLNETAVADQLQKQVVPQIHRAMMELERAFSTALEKFKIEQQNQRRPGAGA